MSRHIKKTKRLFGLASGSLVIITIIGVQLFRDFRLHEFVAHAAYLDDRFHYSRSTGASLSESLASTVQGVNEAQSGTETPALSVPVFVYHGIVGEADRFNMTSQTFRDQMFALKRSGYETITMEEFDDFMNGEKVLYGKPFVLTFDDGRIDSYRGADPILKALDYSAVMFVAVQSSLPQAGHSSYYISEKDIGRMLDSGRWEIGSHAVQETGGSVPVDAVGTKGNFLSSLKWLNDQNRLETVEEYGARVEREIAGSKQTLDDLFKQGVVSFSYPFGDYGQQSDNNIKAEEIIEPLIRENYSLAFRQVWPENAEFAFNRPGADTNHLKRFETPTDWSGEQLVNYLNANVDKPLPFSDAFQVDNGWHGTWGDVQVSEARLKLDANEASSGAGVFLDGSEVWQDYYFTAIVDKISGSHISLMAQYQDANNYLVCTFGEGRVKMERVKNGVTYRLIENEEPTAVSGQAIFGVRVVGPEAQCLINDFNVAQATNTPGPGGVGIRIWDKELGLASATLSGVTIEPIIR